MKTTLMNAEDIPGNAKILINGDIKQVINCDYVDKIWETNHVRFDFDDGQHLEVGSYMQLEVIGE